MLQMFGKTEVTFSFLQKIERLKSELHLLDAEGKQPNKHVFFFDTKKEGKISIGSIGFFVCFRLCNKYKAVRCFLYAIIIKDYFISGLIFQVLCKLMPREYLSSAGAMLLGLSLLLTLHKLRARRVC